MLQVHSNNNNNKKVNKKFNLWDNVSLSDVSVIGGIPVKDPVKFLGIYIKQLDIN